MNEYEIALKALSGTAAGTMLMGSLSKEQTAEVDKFWESRGTISWFESLGLWLLSINPSQVDGK